MEVYNKLKKIFIERLTENNAKGTRTITFSPKAIEQMHETCDAMLEAYGIDKSAITTHIHRRASMVVDMFQNSSISGTIVNNTILPVEEFTFSAHIHALKTGATMSKIGQGGVSDAIQISAIVAAVLADSLKEMNYTFNLPE